MMMASGTARRLDKAPLLAFFVIVCLMVIQVESQDVVPKDNSSVQYDVAKANKIAAKQGPVNCTLVTVYPVRDTLEGFLLSGAKLVEMDLTVLRYPRDFLQEKLPNYFRPHYWVRSTGRQGRSLLVLEDNYDFMSLFFLSIGVHEMNVTLTDSPKGCLGSLTPEEILAVFRHVLLNDFKEQKPGEEGGSLSVDEHVCNVRVKNDDGYARFLYECCHRSPDDYVICEDVDYDVWIEVLMTFILLTKILVVLYSPSFLPGSLYRLKYMANQYIYRIPVTAPLKRIRILITASPPDKKTDPDGARKVVRLSKLKGMNSLKTLVAQHVQSGEKEKDMTVLLDKVRLNVKARRLLGESDVPVGLIKSIYNNLVRCRIRRLYPLNRCCKRRILGKCVNSEKVLQWYMCGRAFAKFLLLCLLLLPWLARIWLYYEFEKDLTADRRDSADRLDLELYFQGSFTLFFTPLHLLFVVIYIIFLVDSLVFGLISKAMKEKMKFVLQDCLRDTRESSRITMCAWVTRLFVVPFDMCGIFGILVAPLYLAILLPFAIPVAVFYMFPALNLTARLIFSFSLFMCPAKVNEGVERKLDQFVDWLLRKLELDDMDDDVEQQRANKSTILETSNVNTSGVDEKKRLIYGADKRKQFKDRFAKLLPPANQDGDGSPADQEGQIKCTDVALQILVIPMCLISFWSVTLLLMEVVSFFVEMAVYTLMGVIVNAGSTLKYLTVLFMVGIYGQSTFSDVRKKYLSFHKDIHKLLLNRKRQEIEELARQDEDVQENTAFRVHAQQDQDTQTRDEKDLELFVKGGKPFWETRGLLMFLDKQDTPYTPEKFFYDSIVLKYYGAPGPLYLSMISACWSFSYILLFLLFVFIVVMAFGDAYSVSSTNQLLATVAGGFIPLLFRFVFKPGGGGSSLDDQSVQFKVEFDRVISDYRQSWPLADIDCELDAKDPSVPREQPIAEVVTENEQPETGTGSEQPVAAALEQPANSADGGNENGAASRESADLNGLHSSPPPPDESVIPVDLIIDISSRRGR